MPEPDQFQLQTLQVLEKALNLAPYPVHMKAIVSGTLRKVVKDHPALAQLFIAEVRRIVGAKNG